MNGGPDVQPLPLKHRQKTFWLLLALFILSLPFLYLYATGYRFEFGEKANLISTGGMYIAAERTGAEIYIDNELVRETRTFRRAFYAQSLDPGTHRVHVQKEGHHTWVKELPVSPHLVTEAQAFNLPLVPRLRVISKWQTSTGTAVVNNFFENASTTNAIWATSTVATSTLVANTEYISLVRLFATTSATSSETIIDHVVDQIDGLIQATSTAMTSLETPTTTKQTNEVTLYEDKGEIYIEWVGELEDMPYYYCSEDFPAYSTTSVDFLNLLDETVDLEAAVSEVELVHPVQTISEDLECTPVIRLDRRNQEVISFDFLPGSTDFVVLALKDGVYVVEVDDRAWQNVQPVLLGENFDMRVENGQIYVYDGVLVYQVILEN